MSLTKSIVFRSGIIMIIAVIFCSSFILSNQEKKIVNIYISTSGDDNNPGSIEKPFGSLSAVQKYMDNLSEPSNVNIYFRKGDYYITESFNLSDKNILKGSSISILGYKDEIVNINGGKKLESIKFKLVTDNSVLNRLSKEAKGNVYQFDLGDLSDEDFGTIMPNGFGKKKTPSAMELFSNDEPMTLARWPNDNSTLLSITNVRSQDTSSTLYNKTNQKYPVFQYSSNIKKDWKDTSNIWVAGYFSAGWAFENLPVKSINQNLKTVYMSSLAHYGINSSSDTGTSILKAAQSIRGFYFYNILEELDKQGEWYFDKKTKLLYVWPNKSIEKENIEVSILKVPIFNFFGTEGINLTNLNFECVRDKFISAANMKNVHIKNCKFINSGTEGIIFNKSSNITIEDCIFKNTGTSSIILDGGNRKTLESGNNVIKNCEVNNYSRISRSGTPGLSLNGVGTIVDHCYLHDAPNQAIIYYGNDHIIKNNYISDVCKDYYDMGAVYTGRDPSSTGTVIMNNLFYHIISKRGSVASIYVDDGSGGIEVKNNLFVESGGMSTSGLGVIHVHGGGDNHMDNNVFINCKKAFSDTPWTDEKWVNMYFETPLYKNQLIKTVDIRSEVYQSRYPQLHDFFKEDSVRKRVNYINNTICYNVQTLNTGKSYKETNTIVTKSNPVSGNVKSGDFKILNIPSETKNWKGWSILDYEKIRKPHI